MVLAPPSQHQSPSIRATGSEAPEYQQQQQQQQQQQEQQQQQHLQHQHHHHHHHRQALPASPRMQTHRYSSRSQDRYYDCGDDESSSNGTLTPTSTTGGGGEDDRPCQSPRGTQPFIFPPSWGLSRPRPPPPALAPSRPRGPEDQLTTADLLFMWGAITEESYEAEKAEERQKRAPSSAAQAGSGCVEDSLSDVEFVGWRCLRD